MSLINVKVELKCPYTGRSVREAFGQEVSLFLHCHLRGYDKYGKGKQMDAEYYDKYGAPVKLEESWIEGYHTIDRMLAKHFNICDNAIIKFPLVAGMGGGAHLYSAFHEENTWNWTGWIPKQSKWLCEGQFFSNRYFLSIRGNEIQNNLWDYHPQNEEEGDGDELEYSQIEPNDRYRGGYFFKDNPFGRYLHVISLKSPEEDKKRYNYIVHPLAYRDSLDNIPDNTVDAMQWSIINVIEEDYFVSDEKVWGEKVHGLEIFNDFTYYYSYLPEEGSATYNGEVTEDKKYRYWFNTYPLEYAEFLLESALTRGVYLHTLCANDAFYQRPVGYKHPPDNEETQILLADPKGHIALKRVKRIRNVIRFLAKFRAELKLEEEHAHDPKLKEVLMFLQGRPYRLNTVFGYTTLIDTNKDIRSIVFNRDVPGAGLEDAGLQALEYLIDGRFYSSTGVYNLFNYESDNHGIPYEIEGQSVDPDSKTLCYEITDDMELVFTFAKCTEGNAGLVWRYSIMISKQESKITETVHGYFKLSISKKTVLDLSQSYQKKEVKWLFFAAINPDNVMRRAWFNAIRGPAFGKPQCDEKEFSGTVPEHKVFSTTTTLDGSVVQNQELQLFSTYSSELDFYLPTANDDNINVYFMQAYPLQQDLTLDGTKNSSTDLPPRYIQNVHGYFNSTRKYPTRLKLSSSWDKEQVEKVYFYQIGQDGQPMDISVKPTPYSA